MFGAFFEFGRVVLDFLMKFPKIFAVLSLIDSRDNSTRGWGAVAPQMGVQEGKPLAGVWGHRAQLSGGYGGL